jgi:hypothetical protein
VKGQSAQQREVCPALLQAAENRLGLPWEVEPSVRKAVVRQPSGATGARRTRRRAAGVQGGRGSEAMRGTWVRQRTRGRATTAECGNSAWYRD